MNSKIKIKNKRKIQSNKIDCIDCFDCLWNCVFKFVFVLWQFCQNHDWRDWYKLINLILQLIRAARDSLLKDWRLFVVEANDCCVVWRESQLLSRNQ